ncbi:MAG: ABC-ATPase domain-containing protein [Defluviitaleaceae bacterium]|nr:ABC-ATPase domain-containing protein [Defluviitaleaceae bacterium]
MLKRLRYYFDRIKNTDNRTTTYRYTVAAVDGDGRKYKGKVGKDGDLVQQGALQDFKVQMVQRDLYDCECVVTFAGRTDPPRVESWRVPTFWDDGVAYTLDRTNKLVPDRPTITIAIPVEKLGIDTPTLGAADFCLRAITPYFEAINAEYANRTRPDKDNGKFYLYAPGAKVLQRNAAYFAMQEAKDYEDLGGNRIHVDPEKDSPPDVFCLCIRLEVQLPHMKLDRATKMLCNQMPDATQRFIKAFDVKGLKAALKLEETQHAIRDFLRNNGYCAFIANGSILARERGSDKPAANAIPFQSPPKHEIEVAGIKGMGIKCGVVVITGGGYSGKSTVLNAVSAGIYNHVAGDGRELCITDDTAVTITAEDGRAVSAVNISPFIKWIPGGDPAHFSTTHASGSTSQGANIMESVSLGAKLLLIDEDRSATNFMIRDAVMKRLIESEPITPFTDRVRELADRGVSTLLVIGGSGEYLSVADDIFMMDEFVMGEVTAHAKSLAPAPQALPPAADWENHRALSGCFSTYPSGTSREKLEVSDTGFIIIGDERIDIRNLHDITTEAQINAVAFILRHLAKGNEGVDDLEAMALAMRGLRPSTKRGENAMDIITKVRALHAQIQKEGLDLVDTGFFTGMKRFMDMPRCYDILAAINRMRKVQWEKYNS